MLIFLWFIALLAGVAAIVWGAELFSENLSAAAARLGVASFALALLLAGAEPEELATVVAASWRGSPGIAFGNVIGTNVAICLVALGVAAVIRTLPFGLRVMRYAALGLPLGMISVWFAWDGSVSRAEGGILVFLYVAYVAVIWVFEKQPPSLGEVGTIEEATKQTGMLRGKVGRELALVLTGLVAMSGGATLLVEAVRRISNVEATQTKLGLTVVAFAAGFELVVLAWSASRRGVSEVVIAGVVGSFAYDARCRCAREATHPPGCFQVACADGADDVGACLGNSARKRAPGAESHGRCASAERLRGIRDRGRCLALIFVSHFRVVSDQGTNDNLLTAHVRADRRFGPLAGLAGIRVADRVPIKLDRVSGVTCRLLLRQSCLAALALLLEERQQWRADVGRILLPRDKLFRTSDPQPMCGHRSEF